jgi:hypothetical protein
MSDQTGISVHEGLRLRAGPISPLGIPLSYREYRLEHGDITITIVTPFDATADEISGLLVELNQYVTEAITDDR